MVMILGVPIFTGHSFYGSLCGIFFDGNIVEDSVKMVNNAKKAAVLL